MTFWGQTKICSTLHRNDLRTLYLPHKPQFLTRFLTLTVLIIWYSIVNVYPNFSPTLIYSLIHNFRWPNLYPNPDLWLITYESSRLGHNLWVIKYESYILRVLMLFKINYFIFWWLGLNSGLYDHAWPLVGHEWSPVTYIIESNIFCLV